MPEITDNDIIEKFRTPNTKHEAFTQLVEKYQESIYHFTRRLIVDHNDTDDVVQNIFIKIWTNLHLFREESKLSTWIYRIASNESINYLNHRKIRKVFSLSSIDHRIEVALHSEQGFSGDAIQKQFRIAVLKLPYKQQLVFNMRYHDELPYDEIASITGTSVGALKASYHIAVKKIEQHLRNL